MVFNDHPCLDRLAQAEIQGEEQKNVKKELLT